jgi:hypothetical protein
LHDDGYVLPWKAYLSAIMRHYTEGRIMTRRRRDEVSGNKELERTYGTQDEMRFLDKLGTYRSISAKKNLDKEHLDKLSPELCEAVIRRMSLDSGGRSYVWRKKRQSMTQADLLVSYISVASRRRRWEGIDGAKVVTYAKQMLERIRRTEDTDVTVQ